MGIEYGSVCSDAWRLSFGTANASSVFSSAGFVPPPPTSCCVFTSCSIAFFFFFSISNSSLSLIYSALVISKPFSSNKSSFSVMFFSFVTAAISRFTSSIDLTSALRAFNCPLTSLRFFSVVSTLTLTSTSSLSLACIRTSVFLRLSIVSL